MDLLHNQAPDYTLQKTRSKKSLEAVSLN